MVAVAVDGSGAAAAGLAVVAVAAVAVVGVMVKKKRHRLCWQSLDSVRAVAKVRWNRVQCMILHWYALDGGGGHQLWDALEHRPSAVACVEQMRPA